MNGCFDKEDNILSPLFFRFISKIIFSKLHVTAKFGKIIDVSNIKINKSKSGDITMNIFHFHISVVKTVKRITFRKFLPKIRINLQDPSLLVISMGT